MKLLFFPIVPCIRKNSALSQGFQASAACVYDKSSAKLKISMERGLCVTDRKKPTFSEKACPVDTICYKPHTDRARTENAPPT